MGATAGSRRAAIVAALLVAGCGDERTARTPGGTLDQLVVATSVDLAGVNELVATNTRFTHEILDLLFLHLLEERPDYAEHPPSFAPALAESWELAADRKSLLFRIRADARWSDGTPIGARDVLFTHRAQVSDQVAWPYAASKSAIEDVVALDERTVLFRLRDANPYLLVDVNDGQILPEHAWGDRPFASWRSSGDWFRERLVTSGPYRVSRWQPGVELALEPSPEQLARAPASPGVVFRVVSDPAALVEQLLAGRFDFADGISPQDAARIAERADLRLLSSAGRQYDYIGWNGARPPFGEPAIRRALTLAIDRQGLVDALWSGHARVAAGPIPAETWARDRELSPWPYDPAAARALLASAGFRDTDGDGIVERGGKPFRFELTTNAGNRIRADALVMIQEQLARVGVAATPRTLEIQALTELNLAGEFDATLAGWSVDTTLDLRPYFHSTEVEDGWNFIRFASVEADELLEALRAESDLDAARPLHHRLQRLLHELQPYTFLWEPRRLAVARADLIGAEPNPLSTFASLPRWRRPAR
jgi:peptide/nickel transport system substrate-binding protein